MDSVEPKESYLIVGGKLMGCDEIIVHRVMEA